MSEEIVYLIISTNEKNQGIDKLNGMNWYLAAKNTWQGTITGSWPYNNIPQKLTENFKQNFLNYILIKVREDIWKYRNGISDFDSCFNQEKNMKEFVVLNCNSIFDKVDSQSQNVSNICKYAHEHLNVTSGIEKSIQKCLAQSTFKHYPTVGKDQFTATLYNASEWTNKALIELGIQFSSNIQIVHEEVLILDDIGLLGSLGGSLGLFIGFSFFGYLSKIIDGFANKILSKLLSDNVGVSNNYEI